MPGPEVEKTCSVIFPYASHKLQNDAENPSKVPPLSPGEISTTEKAGISQSHSSKPTIGPRTEQISSQEMLYIRLSYSRDMNNTKTKINI
ncbi:MAG: hypothetical protein EZS28_003105 [Streblomastix strix]|uniref:Uncharacterized protein n=1 Tax=Streblomastix strix TaxID=222440 RepID=A0A5J4X291_9EUKA|nr:MAG: hypothetical protein EZS28_003105 [Streblomastix strix]